MSRDGDSPDALSRVPPTDIDPETLEKLKQQVSVSILLHTVALISKTCQIWFWTTSYYFAWIASNQWREIIKKVQVLTSKRQYKVDCCPWIFVLFQNTCARNSVSFYTFNERLQSRLLPLLIANKEISSLLKCWHGRITAYLMLCCGEIISEGLSLFL